MDYKKNIPYLIDENIVYYLGKDNGGSFWWKGDKESLNKNGIGIFNRKSDQDMNDTYSFFLNAYDVPFVWNHEDFKIYDYFGSRMVYDTALSPIKKTRLAKKLVKNIIAETEEYMWAKI